MFAVGFFVLLALLIVAFNAGELKAKMHSNSSSYEDERKDLINEDRASKQGEVSAEATAQIQKLKEEIETLKAAQAITVSTVEEDPWIVDPPRKTRNTKATRKAKKESVESSISHPPKTWVDEIPPPTRKVSSSIELLDKLDRDHGELVLLKRSRFLVRAKRDEHGSLILPPEVQDQMEAQGAEGVIDDSMSAWDVAMLHQDMDGQGDLFGLPGSTTLQ